MKFVNATLPRRYWNSEMVLTSLVISAFSALTVLVGQQERNLPVKSEWWGAGVVICLKRGAALHMAQLTPLPLTVSCFIQ